MEGGGREAVDADDLKKRTREDKNLTSSAWREKSVA